MLPCAQFRSNVNDGSTVCLVNEISFVSCPEVLLKCHFVAPPVNVADHKGSRDPNNTTHYHRCEDYVVLQKLEEAIDVNVLNDVPESLHHVMHRPLTNAVVANTLNTRSSIRECLFWQNGETSGIQMNTTASLAGVVILQFVAHAALFAKCFTVGNTPTMFTLSLLDTRGSVCHWS